MARITPPLSGSGGGDTSGPSEGRNTLQSRSKLRIIDLVSEGEIEGLVNGAKSVFFDDTPLQASDDSYNFDNVTYTLKTGDAAQTYLEGFPASETTTVVNVEATKSTTVTRTISDTDVDAVRVIVQVPALLKQNDSTGDVNGHSVRIKINVTPDGGSKVAKVTDFIVGKNVQPYLRSYRIDLDSAGPWDIELERVSDDDPDSSQQSRTFFHSYVTLVDRKMLYPDSAYVGAIIDAEAFGGNVPSRAYEIKGLKVQIPTNYDPVTRTYTNEWAGTFQTAWTDNPAWVAYDLLTNDRYGLGDLYTAADISKWDFYALSQHCDELVADGEGGTHPRFTFNGTLTTREDAIRVLEAVMGMMRANLIWNGGQIGAIQNRVQSAVKVFSPANVLDGIFNYAGTALRARHTVAHIRWNDPDNNYLQDTVVIEDNEGIQRYGYNVLEITAYGCTRKAQAYRHGLFALLTERLETDTVSFKIGPGEADMLPGDIIKIADPQFLTSDRGGRISAINSATSLTLDRDVTFESGESYTLNIVANNPFLNAPNDWVWRAPDATTQYGANVQVDHTNHTITNDTVGSLSTYPRIKWDGVFNIGEQYYVRVEFSGDIANIKRVEVGGYPIDQVPEIGSTGVYEGTFTATGDGDLYIWTDGTAAVPWTVDVDSFIVKRQSSSDGNYLASYAITNPGDTTTDAITLDGLGLSDTNDFSAGTMWTIDDGTVVNRTFRVMAIKEDRDSGTFEIFAMQYESTKFASVEQTFDLSAVTSDFDNLPSTFEVLAPTTLNLTFETRRVSAGVQEGQIVASWQGSDDYYLRGYQVKYQIGENNFITLPETTETQITIPVQVNEIIRVEVRAINHFGRFSSPARAAMDLSTQDISDLVDTLITNLEVRGGGTTFDGIDLALDWDAVGPYTGGNLDVAGADPYFKRFRINVYTTGDVLLETFYTQYTEYLIPYHELTRTGTYPSYKIGVSIEDISGNFSTEVQITVTNAPPALPSITTDVTALYFKINYDRPNAADFRGMLVWMSETSGFSLESATLIYKGEGNPVIKVDEGTTYYFRYAAYDAFSTSTATGSNLNVATEGSFTTPALSYSIGDDEVVQSMLADAAVGAAELIDSAVSSAKIADGAVIEDKVAANAITASKLVVSNWSQLLMDPLFQDENGWTLTDFAFEDSDAEVTDSDKLNTVKALKATGNGTMSQTTTAFSTANIFTPIDPGKSFRLYAKGYHSSGFTGRIGAYIYWQDASKTFISSEAVTGTSYQTTAAGSAGLEELDSSIVTPPATAAYASVSFFVFWSTTQNNAGSVWIGAPRLYLANDGELIVDGSILAQHITAESITASKLALVDFNNLIANPYFEDSGENWDTLAGSPSFVSNANFTSGQAVQISTDGDGVVQSQLIEAKAGDTFRYRFDAYGDGTTPKARIQFIPYDKDQNVVGSSSYDGVRDITGTVDTYTGLTTISDGASPTAYIKIGVRSFDVGAGDVFVSDLFVFRANGAELVVDGTITSAMIQSDTIVAGDIAAATITGAEVQADTLTSAHIAAGAITVSEMADASVGSAEIIDDAVVNDAIATAAVISDSISNSSIIGADIAATTIAGSNIITGTIGVAAIGASAVATDELAASAVTSAKVSANTLVAGDIAASAVDTSELAADAVTATEIATNAVTADAVAANAITAGTIAANSIVTSNIQADNITTSVVASNASAVNPVTNMTWTEIETVSITTTGGKVLIRGDAQFIIAANGANEVQMRFRRDTTTIRDATVFTHSGGTQMEMTKTFSDIDEPSAGTYTYRMDIWMEGDVARVYLGAQMEATELKR